MCVIGTLAQVTTTAITYRAVSTLPECADVIALEREIWGPGYDEAVPISILRSTLDRGAILLGAFEGARRMVGFVYSLRGVTGDRPSQWSYKLGVVQRLRKSGVGYQLKLLQRERALELGCDVIEWTFDPLQVTYGQLNIAKLGAVVDAYVQDCYGSSTVPMPYRGNPTDRFIAAWNIREPRVVERLAAPDSPLRAEALAMLFHSGSTPRANRAVPCGEWLECADVELDLSGPRFFVEIPQGFSDMLVRAPQAALAWRLRTRDVFTTYFSRGYRPVEFVHDRENRKGAYLFERTACHTSEPAGL